MGEEEGIIEQRCGVDSRRALQGRRGRQEAEEGQEVGRYPRQTFVSGWEVPSHCGPSHPQHFPVSEHRNHHKPRSPASLVL